MILPDANLLVAFTWENHQHRAEGHRETTDSYLATLAKYHGIKFATLEEALAKRFPGVSEWVN